MNDGGTSIPQHVLSSPRSRRAGWLETLILVTVLVVALALALTLAAVAVLLVLYL